MKPNTQLLRSIPKIDELLLSQTLILSCNNKPHSLVVDAVRQTIDSIRLQILHGLVDIMPPNNEIERLIVERINLNSTSSLRPVINATGIILHTNLGRAKMSEAVADAVAKVAQGYSTLEYDLINAKRGSRYSHVEDLLIKLTGAEAAMAVNNNAAAVMLILGTLCRDKEVITSRGELVEIGGSFRIPAIMEQSNSKLVEVGTTNKTHLSDYENAISPEKTSALLKVHTSNFKIVGFTKEISVLELSELSKKHNLPLIHDIGSGSLVNLEKYGIHDEPTVMDSIRDGADVVSFSGDKLLGGPQAGIIVGKKRYIEEMKKNPLTRAVRIDKLSLAALEMTLRAYLDLDTVEQNIPTLGMLNMSEQELHLKALELQNAISSTSTSAITQIVAEQGQVGGGSAPTQMLSGYVVTVFSDKITINQLEQFLRLSPTPIIGRISKNKLILDVRTIDNKDFAYIAQTIYNATK